MTSSSRCSSCWCRPPWCATRTETRLASPPGRPSGPSPPTPTASVTSHQTTRGVRAATAYSRSCSKLGCWARRRSTRACRTTSSARSPTRSPAPPRASGTTIASLGSARSASPSPTSSRSAPTPTSGLASVRAGGGHRACLRCECGCHAASAAVTQAVASAATASVVASATTGVSGRECGQCACDRRVYACCECSRCTCVRCVCGRRLCLMPRVPT